MHCPLIRENICDRPRLIAPQPPVLLNVRPPSTCAAFLFLCIYCPHIILSWQTIGKHFRYLFSICLSLLMCRPCYFYKCFYFIFKCHIEWLTNDEYFIKNKNQTQFYFGLFFDIKSTLTKNSSKKLPTFSKWCKFSWTYSFAFRFSEDLLIS